jgi:DNA-binding IclR family transcriptional regulator
VIGGFVAGGSEPGASLVGRTVDVLEAFDEQHRRLSLSTIALRSGLSHATALRITRRLLDRGVLVRDADGRYVIGRRLWEIGLLAPLQTEMRDVASPFLHDLHAATRATVHLAVREQNEVLYLDRLSGNASVPVVSRVGSHLPLHASGVGKVLLAYAPDDVQTAVLSNLVRLTPYTITAPRLLAKQLAAVRRDGFATTTEEMSLGACSIAVPIRVEGNVVAALGVVVPDFRRTRSRLVAALTVSAHGIGRSLQPTSTGLKGSAAWSRVSADTR